MNNADLIVATLKQAGIRHGFTVLVDTATSTAEHYLGGSLLDAAATPDRVFGKGLSPHWEWKNRPGVDRWPVLSWGSLLGAGVLHATGQQPSGNETIVALSNMFTQTLGSWSIWVFAVGAFCILFSSSVAGVAAGGRYIPDYLIELGFMKREQLNVRYAIIRWYGLLVPFIGLALYAGFQRPVLMVTIAGSFAAIMLPVQSGLTLYLQAKRLPKEVRPGFAALTLLRLTFVLQAVLACAVVYFVVF